MTKSFEEMKRVIEKLGFSDFDGYDKFEKYMERILEWNEKVNITNIKDREEFVRKHYIDSLAILGSEEFKDAKKVIDIGTGGGFPGVPLAILCPDKEFMLVDSLNKRIKIIRELIEEIGLANVNVRHGRAEDLAREKDMREKYDICVSRAVAGLPSLVELCVPFVKEGKFFVAYKGPGVFEEIDQAGRCLKLMNCKVDRIEDVDLQETENHKLLFIKKIDKTGRKYPRKSGEPTRNPL